MSHQPYPQFSSHCFSDIIRIARGNTVREELPLFAKCIYTIEGAALGATIGEPDETFGSEERKTISESSAEDLQECYSALISMKEDGPGIYGAGETALPPTITALLMQLGLELIKILMERKKTT